MKINCNFLALSLFGNIRKVIFSNVLHDQNEIMILGYVGQTFVFPIRPDLCEIGCTIITDEPVKGILRYG